MQEKITKKQRIYDGKLVKLDLMEVELPDGNHSHREIIQHPGAVAIVPIDTDNNIYLVKQFRLAANKILLEIPAGTLDPNESPETCALRELQEEISYSAKSLTAIGGIFVAPGYTTEFIHLFIATDLVASSLDMDDDEFLEIVKMPFDEALSYIESGDIVDAKTIVGLLRAARHLNY